MDQVHNKLIGRSFSDISQTLCQSQSNPFTRSQLKRPPMLNLGNVRVIQDNLVYIINLPAAMANEELLRSQPYFGQYGTITKCVVNKAIVYTTAGQGPSYAAYITYSTHEQAGLCIKTCDGITVYGRQLSLTFGTTKYCSYFLRNVQCPKPDCLYLHKLATKENTIPREELPNKLSPQNSLLEKIAVIKMQKNTDSPLPAARLLKERSVSEITAQPVARHRLMSSEISKSRFRFVVDDEDEEYCVPEYILELAKQAKPCNDKVEMPFVYIDDILSPNSPDKWASDIFEVIPKEFGPNCLIAPKLGSNR